MECGVLCYSSPRKWIQGNASRVEPKDHLEVAKDGMWRNKCGNAQKYIIHGVGDSQYPVGDDFSFKGREFKHRIINSY